MDTAPGKNSQRKYVKLMNQARLNHANFEGMNGGIKGEVIINKLSEDFELLVQFMTIKSDISAIGHIPLIELDVIQSELFEMATPLDQQWKDIHRVRNHHLGRPTTIDSVVVC